MNTQPSNCSNNSDRQTSPGPAARARRLLCLGVGLIATAISAHAAEHAKYTLSLIADTGFFERKDSLVQVVLPPGPTGIFPDLRNAVLHAGDRNGKSVPFWFEPVTKKHGKAAPGPGVLYWILAGKTDSLTRVPFVLEAAGTTAPARASCGDPAIAKAAKAARDLLPNGSFEHTAAAKATSTWHGKIQPNGWVLHDFPWHYRNLPDLAASCRVVEDNAFDGKKSVCFRSELRSDAPEASPEKPTLVIGYIGGPTVPLEPSTRYEFSYCLKIADVTRGGYISASVNYLDKEKKRLYPRQYAINRLQTAYGTTRHLPEEYRGRWIRVARSGITLPDAAFGQIQISGSLAGVAYIDHMVLRKLPAAEPVLVIAGSWKRLEDQ